MPNVSEAPFAFPLFLLSALVEVFPSETCVPDGDERVEKVERVERDRDREREREREERSIFLSMKITLEQSLF